MEVVLLQKQFSVASRVFLYSIFFFLVDLCDLILFLRKTTSPRIPWGIVVLLLLKKKQTAQNCIIYILTSTILSLFRAHSCTLLFHYVDLKKMDLPLKLDAKSEKEKSSKDRWSLMDCCQLTHVHLVHYSQMSDREQGRSKHVTNFLRVICFHYSSFVRVFNYHFIVFCVVIKLLKYLAAVSEV